MGPSGLGLGNDWRWYRTVQLNMLTSLLFLLLAVSHALEILPGLCLSNSSTLYSILGQWAVSMSNFCRT